MRQEGNSEKTPLIEAEENSADDDSNDDKLVEVGGGVKRRLVYLTRKECKSSNVDIDAIKFLQKNKKTKNRKERFKFVGNNIKLICNEP